MGATKAKQDYATVWAGAMLVKPITTIGLVGFGFSARQNESSTYIAAEDNEVFPAAAAALSAFDRAAIGSEMASRRGA